MNVRPAFIPDPQATELMQPTDGAFHHPAIDSQAAAMRFPATGNAGRDSHFAKSLTIRFAVIGAIGIEFLKSIAWRTGFPLDRGHTIHQFQQLGNVMTVGRRGQRDNRNAISIGEDMMLGTGFTTVHGAGTGFFAPPTARIVPLSTAQRLKSIWSAFRNWASRISWIFCQMPAFCQSRSRRQQVMPEPHPISLGNSSQGIPDINTNRTPVKHRREGKGLRPGRHFLRGLTGICGSIRFHNSSEINGLAIILPPCKKVYDQTDAISMPFC